MKHISLTALTTLALLGAHAQELRIGTGANLVVSGGAQIVLNDASLVNHGNIAAGNSNFIFSGSAGKQQVMIDGLRINFYNLTINRPSSQLMLHTDISVAGSLAMQGGNIELNHRNIDLGSTGSIAGENMGSYITGAKGGTVTAIALLNASQGIDPGNIGVQISTAVNLGSTVITRGHEQQLNDAGQRSIHRYYDIEPSYGDLKGAVIEVSYFETELGQNSASALSLWSLKNNSRFTMGKPDAAPANAAVRPFVQTYPNPVKGQFTLVVSIVQESETMVKLQDQFGRVVEQRKINLRRGLNTVSWDMSRYSAGTYFLICEDQNVKIIKQ